MVVEVYEVRQRFATKVAELSGYAEADAPFDPSSAPGSQIRPFTVTPTSTQANGTRDRSATTMDVLTRVQVRIQAPVYQSGPSRVPRADEEIKAEPLLVRALCAQGESWMHGLRVSYVSTGRAYLPGDEWLQTDHVFDVGHTVQL